MPTTLVERKEPDVWGPYVNYDDVARLQYGRLLWRDPAMRARLQQHWLDKRHPGRARFLRWRALVEEVLAASDSDLALDQRLRAQGSSLRAVAREIPPVFGSFFSAPSKEPGKRRLSTTASPL